MKTTTAVAAAFLLLAAGCAGSTEESDASGAAISGTPAQDEEAGKNAAAEAKKAKDLVAMDVFAKAYAEASSTSSQETHFLNLPALVVDAYRTLARQSPAFTQGIPNSADCVGGILGYTLSLKTGSYFALDMRWSAGARNAHSVFVFDTKGTPLYYGVAPKDDGKLTWALEDGSGIRAVACSPIALR